MTTSSNKHMKYIMKRFQGVIAVLFVIAAIFAAPLQAHAVSNYGRGAYSNCPFQQSCAPAQPPVVMPSGLEVNINLSDGQELPDNGYQVVVTPLNGQGQTFQKVEMYVAGKLFATFLPGSNGTATYQWDTRGTAGDKQVKIIVYDKDGQSVIKEYKVRIVPAESLKSPANTANTTGSPDTSDSSNPVSQVVNKITTAASQTVEKLTDVVRQIPKSVAVTIPYVPLVGLLIVVLLLLLQSRREAAEVRHLQAILARSKRLADEKDGFVQLTSHYLRTPFTIMQGGADLIASTQPDVDPVWIEKLKTALGSFGASIESLLSENLQDQALQSIAQPASAQSQRKIWLKPSFIIPIILAVALGAMGNVLVSRAHQIPATFLSTFSQVLSLIAVAIGLYVVMRALQLHRRDREIAKSQQMQEVAIDEARNNLINNSVGTLSIQLRSIQEIASGLPAGQATKIMNEGISQIDQVLARFRATATVIPPLSSSPFKLFMLSALLTQSQKSVAETAQQKNVVIQLPTMDAKLASQQPAWLTQVLTTVFDNAIAYSPENSTVEVTAKTNRKNTIITVRDHGSGVSADKLKELFQPFSKAEGAMQFDHPGLGLSLYLDRLLMTALGGSITLEQAPKQGALVTVTFPIR